VTDFVLVPSVQKTSSVNFQLKGELCHICPFEPKWRNLLISLNLLILLLNIFINRGATRTFARGGGNILLCNGRGGVKVGFPPLFRKIFRNKSAFIRVLSRKKGNFKLLHADLAVFNSNRFFVLVFLQNLYFQQL